MVKRGTIAERFKHRCQVGDVMPDPLAFLKEFADAKPQDCCEVLLVDQFERWQRGAPRPVEEYLRLWPVGTDATDLKIRLLAEEFGYREQTGQPPDVEEFVNAFPLDSSQRHTLRSLLCSSDRCSTSGGPAAASLTATLPGAADGAATPLHRTDSLPTSDTFGRYVVRKQLGQGSFGTVFEAYDGELQRRVALKVPRGKWLSDDASVGTFLHEARRTAQLRHPGIVTVHDFGREGDRCYIVYEYIDGESLEAHLSRGSMPHEDIARLIADVAGSLHYAHLQGVIHRGNTEDQPSPFRNSPSWPGTADCRPQQNRHGAEWSSLDARPADQDSAGRPYLGRRRA